MTDRITQLERQLAEARAENERLRAMLKPQWFYEGDDQSSDKCRFSVEEVIDEDFCGWGEHKTGSHIVRVSTAMPGPDIWAVVKFFTDAEKDERDDDEPYEVAEYVTEEAARAAIQGEPT